MGIDYHQEGGKKKYVDNAYNRRIGRVGKSYGQLKKHSPSGGSKSNKSHKTEKIFYLLFSVNILLFDKSDDLGFKVASLDKKNKPNKQLQKYIDFNTLITWYKNHIKDLGKYISTDKLGVTINEVTKLNDGIMSVKLTVDYDTPHLNSDKESVSDEDIKLIGQMIETVDDDGNYPIKIKKNVKYKTNALVEGSLIVGAKLISFSQDQKTIHKETSRKITPSHLVDPKNDKLVKITKVKGQDIVKRLSAGAYYRKHRGPGRILGHVCQIRDTDSELKCLLKRSNGTVYWAKKSKSGKGQELCGNWKKNCKESVAILK